jgi:hypothetical protein
MSLLWKVGIGSQGKWRAIWRWSRHHLVALVAAPAISICGAHGQSPSIRWCSVGEMARHPAENFTTQSDPAWSRVSRGDVHCVWICGARLVLDDLDFGLQWTEPTFKSCGGSPPTTDKNTTKQSTFVLHHWRPRLEFIVI